MRHIAFHDCLTGLPNRRRFNDFFEQSLSESVAAGTPLTLLLLDLDHFKEVNDELGHEFGDVLLVSAAQRIERCISVSAQLARLGGDEFVIVLSDKHDAVHADELAGLIVSELSRPFLLKNQQVSISASIGIASLTDELHTASELLKCADQAMYDAKNRGRGGFSFYTASMHAVSLHKIRLANDLRSALKKQQLEIYYQPIVCNRTGKVRQAEALVRWHHPLLGDIRPAEFIGIAEDSGLILEIGEWVFDTAARQAKQWQRHYADFQMSINVSHLQMRSRQHVARMLECMHELELDGANIQLEIRECVLVEKSCEVHTQLQSLRTVGVKLAMDSFGTGYSSLSCLKLFDIDVIKIDRSFITELPGCGEDKSLCDAIIAIADKMGLAVIAEGVNTQGQHEALIAMGCHFSQGRLFSRPVSVSEFESLYFGSVDSCLTEAYVSVA